MKDGLGKAAIERLARGRSPKPASAHAVVRPDSQERRRPEETVLYRMIAAHWPPFRERMEETGALLELSTVKPALTGAVAAWALTKVIRNRSRCKWSSPHCRLATTLLRSEWVLAETGQDNFSSSLLLSACASRCSAMLRPGDELGLVDGGDVDLWWTLSHICSDPFLAMSALPAAGR
jgi:hypothetical protein